MMSNNGILWKKTYGCLEVIPTVVFQLIQGFAEVKDYHQLMNSNLQTFR
jgi:hypothetical protein